jgi:hypothetical protein
MLGIRMTQEVDANSCGEVGRRQRLAELITVEKNPVPSDDRSEASMAGKEPAMSTINRSQWSVRGATRAIEV